MSTEADVSQAFQLVVALSVEALSETTTSSVNYVQGHSLLTSIEDAVLEIDAEASEIVEANALAATGEDESPFSVGILPTRAAPGKLQRLRALRAKLLGTPGSPGAIQGLRTVIQEL